MKIFILPKWCCWYRSFSKLLRTVLSTSDFELNLGFIPISKFYKVLQIFCANIGENTGSKFLSSGMIPPVLRHGTLVESEFDGKIYCIYLKFSFWRNRAERNLLIWLVSEMPFMPFVSLCSPCFYHSVLVLDFLFFFVKLSPFSVRGPIHQFHLIRRKASLWKLVIGNN